MSDDQIPKMNADAMYLEEVFTDQTVGQIRRMTPVTAEGTVDSSRQVIYVGYTQMITPRGPMPLNFEIEADGLAAAIDAFADTAQQSMIQTFKEMEAMQREQASSIVVPGQQGGAGIQLP